MNRIITILVTIFILLLLYIWISHVWGSEKPGHPRQIVDARDSETLGSDDSSGDIDSSLLTDNSTDYEAEEEIIEDEPVDESEPEPKEESPKNQPATPATTTAVEEKKVTPPANATKTETKAAPKTTAPASKPVATKTSQPISSSTLSDAALDGKHLVIVGNFLQLVNANQRMQELKKAGFNDVEVVNFDLSEYHTVCAGRFDDINEARRLVKKLKDYHKIDAYVRIGS
jgi:cell division septation protein DedD